MGVQNRGPFGGGLNGMGPPPGMMPPHGRGFPFDMPGGQLPPPGFAPQQPHHFSQTSPNGPSPVGAGSEQQRQPGHSRQQSASDRERFESAANQPIARPAPIQRPGSVRPQGPDGSSSDVDDLSKHLGSSALLDDADDPVPPNADMRRNSSIPANPRNSIPGTGLGQLGGFGSQPVPFGTPGSSFGTPFGQSPGLGGTWGSLPNNGMGSWMNNAAFAVNGFQPIGAPPMRGPGAPLSRPLSIRLAICNACRQLSSRGEGDGYHDVEVLLQQMQANRSMPPDFAPPSLKEIEDICETEGDSQNGGGELHVRKNENDATKFAVKWEADAATPDQGRGHSGLSVIGSPVPSKSSPAEGAFGAPGMRRPAPFQPLGAVGSHDG